MREILFRGRRIDTGEWVKGDLLQFHTHSVIHHYDNGCRVANEIDLSTAGQYTELVDKNGTRIFEGDVVAKKSVYDESKYSFVREVSMDTTYRRGWYPFASGDGCGCCEEDTFSPSDMIVIGNIHDNPELKPEEFI